VAWQHQNAPGTDLPGQAAHFTPSLLPPPPPLSLQRLRFMTSLLFTACITCEFLTPFYPQHFLLLASVANVGKAVGLTTFIATGPAFQQALCTANNLADITAKTQVCAGGHAALCAHPWHKGPSWLQPSLRSLWPGRACCPKRVHALVEWDIMPPWTAPAPCPCKAHQGGGRFRPAGQPCCARRPTEDGAPPADHTTLRTCPPPPPACRRSTW
jgi:hypothetical protein